LQLLKLFNTLGLKMLIAEQRNTQTNSTVGSSKHISVVDKRGVFKVESAMFECDIHSALHPYLSTGVVDRSPVSDVELEQGGSPLVSMPAIPVLHLLNDSQLLEKVPVKYNSVLLGGLHSLLIIAYRLLQHFRCVV
jgi:hypothetical protein